jgi:hypothetical protein
MPPRLIRGRAGSQAGPGLIWLTTLPNPRRPAPIGNPDAGQTGWKLHAVRAGADEALGDIRFRRSACGLVPGHGWGVDHYIEDKCMRCQRAIRRAE